MRLSTKPLYALFFFLAVFHFVAAHPNAVLRRDGSSNSLSQTPSPSAASTAAKSDSASTGAASTTASAKPSSSANPTAAASSSIAASSAVASASGTESAASRSTGDVPSLQSSPAPVNVSHSKINPNDLPLQPKITPGLAVAGVILLLTGIVYTLVGIQKRWLHVSLSSAYLTGLAVAVLIIYVMNPPVRNAIQGAYVVACVVTGVVFGALAVIFMEITEGLGCLLGGFCLSMWFLCLKHGGLIASKGGRGGLIAGLTLAAYSLSFSHYTRPYGLIGCTSFAGATVIILGIDCFSRAGLKEFWLYIWDLNDNEFPLGTTTYPITRGIRVEIACTVIICVIGIISQMKLWKVVKDRREQKSAERLRGERDLEQLDEESGRRVEEDNIRDRAEWEATYGDKEKESSVRTRADSGIGEEMSTPRKGSASIVETRLHGLEEESIEMEEIENGRSSQENRQSSEAHGPVVIVRPATKDGPRRSQESQMNGKEEKRLSQKSARSHATGKSIQASSSKYSDIGEDEAAAHSMSVETVPPPPAVVPLPFKVPSAHEDEKDDSSVATLAESDMDPVRHSKRLSGQSILNRLSVGRSSKAFSESEEALVVPHVEDDRASSLAATVDDLGDIGSSTRTTPLPSPQAIEKTEEEAMGTAKRLSTSSHGATRNEDSSAPDQANKQPEQRADLPGGSSSLPNRSSIEPSQETADGAGVASEAPEERISLETSKRKSASSGAPREPASPKGKSAKSVAPSETSISQSNSASLKGNLPASLSKVAMSYRTNEWAKHLASAEKPDPEELKLPQTTELEQEEAMEMPVPVNIEDLQASGAASMPPAPKRAFTAPSNPVPLIRSSSRLSMQEQSRGGMLRSASSGSTPNLLARSGSQASMRSTMTAANNGTPVYAHGANNQQQPSRLSTLGFRSSSTPLTSQVLVESPIEDMDPPASPPQRYTPSPLPGNTLLGKRDTLLRNKMSSTSLNQAPSPTNPWIVNDTASIHSHSPMPEFFDDDDLPLAERKEIIRRRQQTQQLLQREQTPSPSPATMLPKIVNGETFDSHQPKRSTSHISTDKRETMLATWRSSLRQDVSSHQQPVVKAEAARADMLNDRNQRLVNQQQQAIAAQQRDNMLDERMRRGGGASAGTGTIDPRGKPPSQALTHTHTRPEPVYLSTAQPARWSLGHRLFGGARDSPPHRTPASRLLNPINHAPREFVLPAVRLQHPQIAEGAKPGDSRDSYPLLTLDEQRRSRQLASSLYVESSGVGDGDSRRESVGLPSNRRKAVEALAMDKQGKDAAAPQLQDPVAVHVDLEQGGKLDPIPSRATIPASQSNRSQASFGLSPTGRADGTGEENTADDGGDDFAWGPSHPCFPHPNPHVPLSSPLYSSTRIIRIKRDWMVAGDLAPTFSNMYPEILDPMLPEDQFRKIIRKLNDELIEVFDPYNKWNWVDGCVGLLTFWVWDDLGFARVKRRLRALESWIESWNNDVGDREGVRIVPLRRTGYMTLDIQIPDPHIATEPSQPNSRPVTEPSLNGIPGAYLASQSEAQQQQQTVLQI
ncbi:MAG: hypothetical protein M1819_007105 [Sarea resinae]|nr:MAG: hypothetical protein M1819_007105 [Sarea resinae]